MLGKLGDMMKKLQEMKQASEELKKKLETMNIDYESEDRMFRCTMNGNRIFHSLYIDSSLQQLPAEEFQKKIMKYLNESLLYAQHRTEEEIKKIARDVMPDLPL